MNQEETGITLGNMRAADREKYSVCLPGEEP
jgi:hypothetical protein